MSNVAEERLAALVDGKPANSYDELSVVETMRALRQRPEAPQALRESIRRLEPERRRPAVSWRRGLLVAVPACVVVAIGAALVAGVVSSGSRREQVLHGEAAQHGPRTSRAWVLSPNAKALTAVGAASLPPSAKRLQAYDAYLRLRVRGVGRLSSATKHAMSIARSLGGYVAAVNIDTARQGDASLRLRVPVGRVQEAVSRLSGLGSIVAQSFSVTDLQRDANQQLTRIAQLEGRIGRLRMALRDPSLSPERRARLQLQLAELRRSLASSRAQHRATVRRGRLATVTVSLTTRAAPAAPVKHSEPGRIDRALRDVGSVLAKEIAWILYVLVVLAPLALLVAAAIVLVRFARRRGERLVLDR